MGEPRDRVHVVVVQPSGITFAARPGESVMGAAERAGYRWPTLCHGCAICTRCWIQVAPDQRDRLSPMQPREREALDRVRWRGVENPSERLACQASPISDAVVFKEGVSVRT